MQTSKITVAFIEKQREWRDKKGIPKKKMQYMYLSGDDDNGRLTSSSSAKFFFATGTNLGELCYSIYHLEGYWSCCGGIRQFNVTAQVEEVPNKTLAVIEFLSHITLTVNAKKIYKELGEDALVKLDENLSLIDDIISFRPQRTSFKRKYVKRRFGNKLIQELSKHDVSFDKCVEIALKLPNAYKVIQAEPYILYTKFNIPFPKVDAYAYTLGIGGLNENRVEAAIQYAIQTLEFSTGSCGFDLKEVYKTLNRILREELSHDMFSELFNKAMSSKKVAYIENMAYRYSTYMEESIVAKRIFELNSKKVSIIPNVEEKVSAWEKKKGEELGCEFHLHPLQREAIVRSLNSGFSIITGGPGCGKTTIIEAVVSIWQEYAENPTVCQVCPTGKAAQRMTEATNLPASTIHSRLEIFDSEDYEGTENVIEDGLVICDESSMLDIHVASDLLYHIKDGSKVILVGDIHQLPSVGCGAVLRDIIASEMVPVTMLEKPFRQAEGSSIIKLALNINEGSSIFTVFNQRDSFYIKPRSLSNMCGTALGIYQSKVAQWGIDNVCMLTPLHHHMKSIMAYCPCSDDLNQMAQAAINPRSEDKAELIRTAKRRTGFNADHTELSNELIDVDLIYRMGDIVMNTKNGKGVTNGDIGTIVGIGQDNGEDVITVSFPQGERIIRGKDIDSLELGYSMSIHKSQGSEYACVIICLPKEAKQMLQRNLFYTGITRAKKEVIVLSTDEAIDISIEREDVSNRRTLLQEKLIMVFKSLEKKDKKAE